MSRSIASYLCLLAATIVVSPAAAAGVPTETVQKADQALAEIMAIRAKAIPERLLAEAHGVAIIPNVIKIGFVAGARRGHGVVMVRDNDGDWSLPQFVTLTGGSVGWQAGVEGSDIVLIFTTQSSVHNLMKGKFTIGADIAAAAGPIGRDASAATDPRLKAEILSYSRSRGLFLGVAIDGSALEIDDASHAAFYGSESSETPRQIPPSAARLRLDLVHLTPAEPLHGKSRETARFSLGVRDAVRLGALRGMLDQSSRQLFAVIGPEWQSYLALPAEVSNPDARLQPESLRGSLAHYDLVATGGGYQSLANHAEFQRTHELLRELTEEVSASAAAAMPLPPPPVVEHEFTGRAEQIIDGDTIKVLRDGKPEIVRLRNVDAPELAQPYGNTAKKFAEALCLDEQVRVVWSDRDAEGRILGVVYEQDGFNVSYDMARAGLAWELNDDRTLTELEAEARTAKRGLWADRHPTPPWEYRKQQEKPTPGGPAAAQPAARNRFLDPIRW